MDLMSKIGIGVCLVIFGVIMSLVGGGASDQCSSAKHIDRCTQFANIVLYGGFAVALSGLGFTALVIKLTPADPKEPTTKGEERLS